MRISFSLQDLRTVSRDLGENDDVEAARAQARSKMLRLSQREGTASFSKEKSSPSTPTKRKKWISRIIVTIAIILLLVVAFVGSRILLSYMTREALRYHVILDCGSTGTRVYVYQWSIDHSKEKKNMPIVLRSLPGESQQKSGKKSGRAYHRKETEPGFDKLVNDELGLSSALLPLLRWAEKQIPKHAHKSTPIFLYATAGVRRLPHSDSDWLLAKAWTILKNSSFLCKKDWVKIITGMEEAYYGWIALNHHMEMLGTLPAKKTYGSLDLGGSSLQVTFETEKPLPDETSVSLRIASSSHHLSAYSLSGYGLNDAFDKSVAHLLKGIPNTTIDVKNKIEIKHPCLNTGYKEDYTCSRCAALKSDGSPSIGEKILNKGLQGMVVKLVGAPQWQECSALAKVTVNLSEWSNLGSGIDCNLKPCALTEGLPQPQGEFYAMSGFFVVFRFFNLTSEASLKDVLRAGKKFCGKTWKTAKHSVASQPFIEQYCFRAPYIVSLLRDGLHIKDRQVIIGSGSITWTLGVALLEAGQAVSSRINLQGYKIMATEISPAIVMGMILMSLVFLCCALSWLRNWLPRLSRRLYLPFCRHNGSANSVFNISTPFRFQRWSPINTGDARTKPPLSPTVRGSVHHPFGTGYGFGGGNIEHADSSSYPLGVSHSYSASSLGQIQFGNGVGSIWAAHRGPTTLSSRRSQSREDLNASLAEAHLVKS